MTTHDEYCGLLETEIGRLAEAVGAADPAARVPGCPDWDVAQLAGHVGTVHRWAELIVRTRPSERISASGITAPEDPAELPGWLIAGGADLVTTLRGADPDADCWAWGPEQNVRWWARRQFHETLIHRGDAEEARGVVPVYSAFAASDAIDEFLGNIGVFRLASPRLKELDAGGQSIHLHATDADGEWMIDLTDEGFSWHRGHGKGTAAVQGPLTDLLNLVYNRRSPEGLTIFGDTTLLDHWLTAVRFGA